MESLESEMARLELSRGPKVTLEQGAQAGSEKQKNVKRLKSLVRRCDLYAQHQELGITEN